MTAAASHSTEAERGTLAVLLSEPERALDVLATLRPDHFHEPVHRDIFQAVADLTEQHKPVDLVTVTERLKTNQRMQAAGGSAYLAELCLDATASAHVNHYAAIVREHALRRAITRTGGEMQTLAADTKRPATDALERAEQLLLTLSRCTGNSDPQHIADVAAEGYERYAELHTAENPEELRGLNTGFADLDRMLDGLEPGSLTILAARPSMGKTSLALNIAQNVSRQGKTAAVFSLEMSRQQLLDRIVASVLGAATWKLKKGKLSDEEFNKLTPLFDSLKNHPLYIDDDTDATLVNLRSKARRQQLKHGLDLLIIDYLQLIEVTDRVASENRTQQVTHISRSLKNLARELHCPVIALSQLSRRVEERNPPIPILSDLRESGAIEQDADTVLCLYRESFYNEDCANPQHTDVYVRKNRNGPTGSVTLHFAADRMTFTSIDNRKTGGSVQEI